MAGQDTGAPNGAPSLDIYVFSVFDAVTDALIASLSIEGDDAEAVLRFAAFDCGELFDRPHYLTTGGTIRDMMRLAGYDV